MARPDPIQYAERLYGAIRAANFSPISFLAFGNAIKEGVSIRNMPRIAAEPFMRVVGEMLDLEMEAAAHELAEAEVVMEAEGAAEKQSSALPTPAEPPREVTTASEEPANSEVPAVIEKAAAQPTPRGKQSRH